MGDVFSIEHLEAVGHVHQSHSFVRGNWGNTGRASFMLLQKRCHDLDILQWLLGKECKRIQSFGSRNHFRIENAPEGAPERCTDGCPHADKCYYNAVRLYYDAKTNAWFRDACAQKPNPTDEEVWHALETTQYGKCVYKCDNDVVDHQTANMEFEDGTTVTMTMSAFTRGGRKTHIMGTKGELFCNMGAPADKAFEFFSFDARATRYLDSEIATAGDSITGGHGGGEDEETPLQAAIREAAEEANITSDAMTELKSLSYVPADCIAADRRKHWDKNIADIPEHCFAVECNTNIVLSHEHTEFAWLNFEESFKMLKWESNRTALCELTEILADK